MITVHKHTCRMRTHPDPEELQAAGLQRYGKLTLSHCAHGAINILGTVLSSVDSINTIGLLIKY